MVHVQMSENTSGAEILPQAVRGLLPLHRSTRTLGANRRWPLCRTGQGIGLRGHGYSTRHGQNVTSIIVALDGRLNLPLGVTQLFDCQLVCERHKLTRQRGKCADSVRDSDVRAAQAGLIVLAHQPSGLPWRSHRGTLRHPKAVLGAFESNSLQSC